MATMAEMKKVGERVEKVKAEVAALSVQNKKFRAALMADAPKAIAEEYGIDPSFFKNLKVRVVEEKAGEIVMTIPGQATASELSDDQLEAVAGGFAFIAAVSAVTAAVSVGAGIAAGTRAGRQW